VIATLFRPPPVCRMVFLILALAAGHGASAQLLPERLVQFHPEHRTTQADRGSWISPSALSSDGNRIVFTSAATNLVAADRNGHEDVFLFDAAEGALRRVVTHDPERYLVRGEALIDAAGGHAYVAAQRLDETVHPPEWTSVLSRTDLNTGAATHVVVSETIFPEDITASGRYIAFRSHSSSLVPGFSDGTGQAYRLDTTDGSIVPLSRIEGVSFSGIRDVDLSGDGRIACFTAMAPSRIWITELDTGLHEEIPLEVDAAAPLSAPFGCQLNDDGSFVAFVDDGDTALAYRRDRAAQETQLISRRMDGQPAELSRLEVQISGSGLRVAFASADPQIVLGDSLDSDDVFVFDQGKAIRKITPTPAALTADVHDGFVLSADGDHLLLATRADLDAQPGRGSEYTSKLFRLSDSGASVVRVSESRTGVHTAEPSEGDNDQLANLQYGVPPYMSANGNRVVFATYDTRTHVAPPVQGMVVVMRAVSSDASTVISLAPNGDAMSGELPAISPDGRFVTFISRMAIGGEPANGFAQLYLRDTELGTTRLISKTSDGLPGNGDTEFAAISEAGGAVVFTTSAPNLGSGTGLRAILWNASTDELQTLGEIGLWVLRRAVSISADGSRVAFSSNQDDLVPQDLHAGTDVFVFDAGSSSLRLVDAGSVAPDYESLQPAISGDGRVVAFNRVSQGGTSNRLMIHDVASGATEQLGDRQLSGLFPSLNHDGSKVVLQNGGAIRNLRGVPLQTGIALVDRDSGDAISLDLGFADHVQPLSGRAPVISADGDFVAFLAQSGAYDREYQHGKLVLHRVQPPRVFVDGFEADNNQPQ
jgi:Tol biopolymer transport system component